MQGRTPLTIDKGGHHGQRSDAKHQGEEKAESGEEQEAEAPSVRGSFARTERDASRLQSSQEELIGLY
jgi:hypothetical protein